MVMPKKLQFLMVSKQSGRGLLVQTEQFVTLLFLILLLKLGSRLSKIVNHWSKLKFQIL